MRFSSRLMPISWAPLPVFEKRMECECITYQCFWSWFGLGMRPEMRPGMRHRMRPGMRTGVKLGMRLGMWLGMRPHTVKGSDKVGSIKKSMLCKLISLTIAVCEDSWALIYMCISQTHIRVHPQSRTHLLDRYDCCFQQGQTQGCKCSLLVS